MAKHVDLTQELARAIIEETTKRLGDGDEQSIDFDLLKPVEPITAVETVSPKTYLDARAIGDHLREGMPLIVNLSFVNDSEAIRLLDFTAGLAYAARWHINRVTEKVFLVSPPEVMVDPVLSQGEELNVEKLADVMHLWSGTGE